MDRRDVMAAVAVTFLAVPQGVAYAMIAGLPPAMGLYAGALPVIVASIARSSRHVVSGPSNALSLLVGAAVAGLAIDPVAAAVSLALWVGLIQLGAAALRLGTLVDYISSAVVLGYITGAGVLIGWGQLPNVVASNADAALAIGTVLGLVALKRWRPAWPGAILAVGVGTALSWGLGLDVRTVVDLAPVPAGLPPFTLPTVEALQATLPVAGAVVVLSLVESSAVGRSIAARTGDRLDTSRDFAGQGLANVVAAFSGGYPTSGSLSRSALNERAGAQTRWAGALAGVMMLGVLLVLGPVVDHVPIASLAGLLLVVARGLVDADAIRDVLRASFGDRVAFVVTVLSTWILPLDRAIYLGVAISLVLFLRRARHLVVRELRVDADLRLQEGSGESCPAVKVLHVEGQLFFASAGELRDALDDALDDADVRVLVVRLKRAHGMDYTAARVLADTAARMHDDDRHLLLVGMRARMMERLEASGVTEVLGEDRLYPTQEAWFAAMDAALQHAMRLVDHEPDCPLSGYLARRAG